MSTGVGGTHFEDQAVNLNAAKLNQLNPLGHVYQDSSDSAAQVSVRACNWIKSDATDFEYAGSNNNAVTLSSTRWVYLDDTNSLQIAATLPALSNDFWVCAKVVTNGSGITEIHNYNMPSGAFRS